MKSEKGSAPDWLAAIFVVDASGVMKCAAGAAGLAVLEGLADGDGFDAVVGPLQAASRTAARSTIPFVTPVKRCANPNVTEQKKPPARAGGFLEFSL